MGKAKQSARIHAREGKEMVFPHASTQKKKEENGFPSLQGLEAQPGGSWGWGRPALLLPSSGGSRTGTTTLLRALGSWGCVFPLSKEDLVGRRLVKPWRDRTESTNATSALAGFTWLRVPNN